MNQNSVLQANLAKAKIGTFGTLLEVNKLKAKFSESPTDNLIESITAINLHAHDAFYGISKVEECLTISTVENTKNKSVEDFEIIKNTDEKPKNGDSPNWNVHDLYPVFHGEPGQFAAFWKEFTPIHNSSVLDDCAKLEKLLDSLHYDVKVELGDFDKRAENYKVVIDLLFEKYNRPDAVEQSLIGKISLLPEHSSKKGTFASLNAYVCQLKSLDYDIEDPTLFQMVEKRIPKKLYRHLEKTGTKKSTEEYMTQGRLFYMNNALVKDDDKWNFEYFCNITKKNTNVVLLILFVAMAVGMYINCKGKENVNDDPVNPYPHYNGGYKNIQFIDKQEITRLEITSLFAAIGALPRGAKADRSTFSSLNAYLCELKARGCNIENPILFQMMVDRLPLDLYRHITETFPKASTKEYMAKGRQFYNSNWMSVVSSLFVEEQSC